MRLFCRNFAVHSLMLIGLATAPALADPKVIYEQLCASCHGGDLEGGKGGRLAGDLRHGDSPEDLARAIRAGFPLTGMPAVGEQLNDADINALVVYLREKRANQVEPGAAPPLDQKLVRKSEKHDYRLEVVVEEGIAGVPWSFDFLPDGRVLLTERNGHLRVIDHGKLVPAPIEGLPEIIERGEGGLMAVAVPPDYARSGWIYLSFTEPGAPDHSMTKVVRGKIRDNRFVDQETIFSLPKEQYQEGYVLFGSRITFDGEYVFFSIGERGTKTGAQDLKSPVGKIHRTFADGKAPPDNPFVNEPGAIPTIWALGVRNPQGLAFNPSTHELWEAEHGPRGGDELNYIERGKNYGWPLVSYGMNYEGTPVSDKTEAPGLESPRRHWTPSIATSQVGVYTGDQFPAWKNNVFLGSLAQQKFIRFEVAGGKVTHEEEIFSKLGRVRDIKTGPDGLLYVLLEKVGQPSGLLVRLVPPASKSP